MTATGLLERAKKLGIDISDTNTMLKALLDAAESLEGARAQISRVIEEVRMHNTLSRERVKWLTHELDGLRAQIDQSSPPGGAA